MHVRSNILIGLTEVPVDVFLVLTESLMLILSETSTSLSLVGDAISMTLFEQVDALVKADGKREMTFVFCDDGLSNHAKTARQQWSIEDY